MPIRINLLAEAQIAEDLRRRDPVKRAIYAGAFLVVLALVWSSSLQLGVMISKNELAHVQSAIEMQTNQWETVVAGQKQVYDARARLSALQQLSQSRFLQGNLMNALQQLNLDGIELTRVKVDQSYQTLDGSPAKTVNGKTMPAKPPTTAEQIVVSLDARDVSASPGDRVNKFKEVVANQPYLKSILNPTNGVELVSLSAPSTGPDGRSFVMFTLKCNLPLIIR